MTGREYQLTHINSTVEKLTQYQKVLAQLPTGGGKTVEFSLIAKRFIENTGKSVLILVHREELMKQAADKIKKILNIDACLITSETKHFKVSRVFIGMVESTVKRTHLFDNVGLIIIDECHMANFNKIHSLFLEEFIIGFTATPKSSSKKEPLNKYYKAIITGPQISQLIEWGFLAQNITRCPKDIVDSTKLEIDRLKGDFNEAQMAAEYSKPKFIHNVVMYYKRYCKGEKTLIFNVNIAHSKEVNDIFVACGFNSRHLDSDSNSRPSCRPGFKNEREEIMDWFKNTEDAILNNVMIATVGFDEPTILNVINNFSTLSVVKWIQTAGRGGRRVDEKFIEDYQHLYPYPLSLKTTFNIIDLGGNAIRFGDWNDNRDWKYIFDNPDRPNEGIAPTKICPQCEGMLHASKMVCDLIMPDKSICLYEFQRKKAAPEKAPDEMVLITKGILNIDDIIEKGRNKYAYYPMFNMAETFAKQLFENFKNPSQTLIDRTFAKYYEYCIEWWKKDMVDRQNNTSYLEISNLPSIPDITHSAWHIKIARYNFDKHVKSRQLSLDLNDFPQETSYVPADERTDYSDF